VKQAKPLQPYRPWTVDEDCELVRLQEEGHPARDIAELLDRSAGAIRSRGAIHSRALRLGLVPAPRRL